MYATKTYDGMSIMHYPDNHFGIPGTKVFTPIVEGFKVKQEPVDFTIREKPTTLDAKGMCVLYKDICDAKKAECRMVKCPSRCDAKDGSKACQDEGKRCAKHKCDFMRLLE